MAADDLARAALLSDVAQHVVYSKQKMKSTQHTIYSAQCEAQGHSTDLLRPTGGKLALQIGLVATCARGLRAPRPGGRGRVREFMLVFVIILEG